MSLVKIWNSCCLRRRFFASRLFPACLQLALIIIIWWILKSQTSSELDKKDHHSDENQLQCQLQGFSRTKTLHFLNLGSIFSNYNTLKPSNDLNMTGTLTVDLYIHDAKMGTVVLYPAGTLVSFYDEKKGDEIGEDKVDTEYEYEDNKASDDYLANAYDNYDAKAKHDHQIISDNQNFHGVDRGKETLINIADGSPQKKDVNNQAFDFDSISNQLQKNVVGGFPNSGVNDQVLYQNQMLKPNGGGQVTDNGFEKGQNANLYEQYGMQNSLFPNNKFHFMPQHQNIGGLKPDMNNLNAQPDSLQNPALSYQNANAGVVSANGPELRETRGLRPQFQVFPRNAPQNLINQPNFARTQDSYNVQHVNAFSSRPELSDVRSVFPSRIDSDSVLTEGFLDRAAKIISEVHGKTMDQIDPSSSRPLNVLLMNNPQTCQKPSNIDILYLINSKPQSSDLRQRIRETFVLSSNFQPFDIVHVFLVGKTTSSNFQASLNQEQAKYGDIVQGDFMDVPENATVKGLMGMRWVVQFCHQAEYIMTINEDVFVDTFKLLRGLIPAVNKIGNKRTILCYFNPESPIPRSGPNAVNENLFPGRINMRPYCKGFAVLMTRGVMHSLLAASAHMQPINMDELYLYGILPFIAGGIDVYDLGNKRAFNNFGMETVGCYNQKLDKCPFVASVAFSERFTSLWEFVKTRPQEAHRGWEDERSLWNLPSYIRKF